MERQVPFYVPTNIVKHLTNYHKNENSNFIDDGKKQPCKREKLLISGVIFLTSEKFFTFTAVIGCLVCWLGILDDSSGTTGFGGMIFLAGFSPWSIRLTLRDVRQQRSGVKTDI